MIKIGDKVKVVKISSAFYGLTGTVFMRDFGTCWKVKFDNNIGCYFFESELIKV